ncbi:MAG: methyltransferase domain-containing protein [bacterium]|nr:methyltransferase domain-containing protein [bacterium]
MQTVFIATGIFLTYLFLAHYFSYTILKNKTLKKRKWGLNICCGRTDGGGVNADIKKHKDLPDFVLIKDVYNLPFTDKQFKYVLCSHTIEHVDDPKRFYQELKRVGGERYYCCPAPLGYFRRFSCHSYT